MTTRNKLVKKLANESIVSNVMTLSSGAQSDYYIDYRVVSLDPEGAYLTSVLLFNHLKRLNFDSISGVYFGGSPIVSALSLHSYMQGYCWHPCIIGLNDIMGTCGNKTIIIDDVITTGNSILHAASQIEKFGVEVVELVVVVNRTGKDIVKLGGYDISTMISVEEIFNSSQLGCLHKTSYKI